MVHAPQQRGFLLLPVVLALAVIAAIALMIDRESASGANDAASEGRAARVEHVAQAAIAHTEWQLAANTCGGDFTLPANALGVDTYSAAVSGIGTTTSYTVGVDEDAYIKSDHVGENQGDANTLAIKVDAGKFHQALFHYDLSSLSTGAQINSATGWFYVKGDGAHPDGPITVHRVTGAWSEADVTWTLQNGNFDSAVLDTIPAQATGGVWVRVNLTAQVQAWVNGQENFGILLRASSEGIDAKYISSEGVAGERPRLEVVVGTAPASPATVSATATLADGTARTVARGGVGAYQPPTSMVLKPGPLAGKDAYIWAFNQNTNYGNADETWVVTGSNNETMALFEFNLGALPPGARIINAELSVYHRDGNDNDVPITAHRITQAWDETFVTWNQRLNGIGWSGEGADFASAVAATTEVGPDNDRRYAWNVSDLVQNWLDGKVPNYGLLLRTVASNIFGERFDTSDHADPDRHPQLVLTYACECRQVCLSPQGAGNLLMVVDNPSLLTDLDQALRDSFGAWGYRVTLIADHDAVSNFNSALANNDVVFIAESANANVIDSKLTEATIGIVSAEGHMNDRLGLADDSVEPAGTTINITDNSHYITAPFAGGALQIYAAGMAGLSVSGSEAAELEILAEWGSAGTLVVLDTGSTESTSGVEYSGDGIASGRRVMVPLGGEGNFNWSYVNSNGRLLVHRALEWARGVDLMPEYPGLWISTANDVSASDVPGLDAWGDGEALAIGQPNFALEPGTSTGTFSSVLDLASFGTGGSHIDAIHYVNADITVGVTNSVDLLAGDILLSIDGNTTLTSSNSLAVDKRDVFVFRPDTPGDYSAGTFIFLIEGAALHAEADTVGVSLVEKGTAVGDGSLGKGSFIMAIKNRRDVIAFIPDDVGAVTSGTFAEFIDGPSLNFNTEIRGLDLAEDATEIGGQTVPEGSILITLNHDDDDGVGDNLEPVKSVDIFFLTVTTVGASPVADATLLFEGNDVNLDISAEDLQSLTLTNTVPGSTVKRMVISTESAAQLGGLSFGDKDLAEYDPASATATLFFDGVARGNIEDLDALHVLANGHLVLSAINTTTIGGQTFENEDLIDYDPVADEATLLFDGSALFTSGSTDISAVHVLENGHFLLSNEYTATLGGISFGPNDLIEYDPVTNTATLFFDGDAVGFTSWINAVHRLDNGHLVLSIDGSGTLGGLNFDAGDLVDYDPVTDNAVLYFNGDLFTNAENIRSLHVGTGSADLAAASAPMAHWKLDETSGAIAVDSIGGHDGSLVDNPQWQLGVMDGALEFDGVNDYVDAGTFDVVGTGLTMMGWFRANAIDTDDPRIVSKSAGPNESDAWWQLSTSNSGADRYLRMRIKAGGTTTTFGDSGSLLEVDRWYFAVGTYDNASGMMKLYLDGVELGSQAHAVGGDLATDNTVPVALGANGTAERFFDGLLDDVRIYNRPLSASEIADLYTAGTQPLAHWQLDETTGSIAIDTVGGHDATRNGGSWTDATIDGGIELNGSSAYLSAPDDAELDLTAAFTLMGWVNNDTLSGYDIMFSKGDASNEQNFWLGTHDDEVSFGFYDGGYREFETSGANLSTATWYHLAASFNNATDEVRVYLDGTQIYDGATGQSPLANEGVLYLGRSQHGEYVDGTLDDLRIFNYALDDTQIASYAALGGGGGVAYRQFTEAKRPTNGTSLTIDKPSATAEGDLLILALATDGDGAASFTVPAGWNPIDIDHSHNKVSLGVWWKLAGAAEPADYAMSWSGAEQAYAMVLRFTGHDAATPINVSAAANGISSSPTSPAVTTTVANAMIVRFAAFDQDAITVDIPGLDGHTPISMDESKDGTGTTSAGAGYVTQPAAGDSGTATFSLTASEEYRAVTIGIAPQ